MPHVVVLGSGVIGLSSALRIQAEGHQVTIVARDFPGPGETVDPIGQINYTSLWGGAHNRWVLPTNTTEERDHDMALKTFANMKMIHEKHPEAGITFCKGIEYLEAPGPVYQTLDEDKAKTMGMEEFRLLRPEELPNDVRWGCEYKTWCVNSIVFCTFLLRRFVFRGGKIVKREVRDPAEIFSMNKELGDFDVVVNCSGNGFGDENVFITRGQTCLVANECPATVTRQNADGTWTFSVPRFFEGGTVIGGTKEPNDWNPQPSLEVREKILQNFAVTYPQILAKDGKFSVLRDIVGRRPTRKGGLRLEKEQIGEGKCIIHAYGLGGRGYELSWGVADGVAQLLSQHLDSRSTRPASRTSKL